MTQDRDDTQSKRNWAKVRRVLEARSSSVCALVLVGVTFFSPKAFCDDWKPLTAEQSAAAAKLILKEHDGRPGPKISVTDLRCIQYYRMASIRRIPEIEATFCRWEENGQLKRVHVGYQESLVLFHALETQGKPGKNSGGGTLLIYTADSLACDLEPAPACAVSSN